MTTGTMTAEFQTVNGKDYKVVDGTFYNINTPNAVISWLETSRQRQQRIRIFLGDTETGKDWCEEWHVMGTVGRSTGQVKVPLLIHNVRSTGGSAILDHCIVRIRTADSNGNYQDVYKHPNYHTGEFEIKDAKEQELLELGLTTMVYRDGINVANFRNRDKASKYIAFMKGETQVK